MFHPLAQNTIKAFKSRAQAIFSLLETPPPLVYKILVREIFSLFYIKVPKETIYIKNWILIAVLRN
jgi:hypothetical protein